jgi:16S rRNA (guanine(966)-N(2))-methyltransferase RsmD
LRETLFNVLCGGNASAIEGTTWLDLFAGTGAVGIEAISRGAERVTFVESNRQASDLIVRNLQSLQISESWEVLRMDVLTALMKSGKTLNALNFVFLDPPYSQEGVYRETLDGLGRSTVVDAKTIVIAEHDRKFDSPSGADRLMRYRKLEQGDSALSFYRRTA